jgi:hypothetical protein
MPSRSSDTRVQRSGDRKDRMTRRMRREHDEDSVKSSAQRGPGWYRRSVGIRSGAAAQRLDDDVLFVGVAQGFLKKGRDALRLLPSSAYPEGRANGRGVDRLDLQALDVLIAGRGGNDQNSGMKKCSGRITVIH